MQMQMDLIQFLILLRQPEEAEAAALQVLLPRADLEEVVAHRPSSQPVQAALLIKDLQAAAAA